MLGLRALSRRVLGSGLGRTLVTFSEAPAAAASSAAGWGGPLPQALGMEAWRPAAAAFPWSTTACGVLPQQQQQPVSLSAGLAATVLAQQPAPAASGLWAPQQQHMGGVVEWLADSVRRKRKRAMNKHKHRKRRKLNRMRK